MPPRWGPLVFAVLVVGPAACGAEPIPDALRAELKLAPFYQRYADAGGLPVVGSAEVSDHALAEAAWIVGRMLGERPDLVKAMRANRVRVAVMAATEYTTDLPEHANMKPKLYWDRRARGLGATRSNPVVSCGEENLLGYRGDPYPAENIFVHEFAHAIHGTGLSTTDPTFDRRLRAAYQAARDRGLWKNTYAATNAGEYWAEGVQCSHVTLPGSLRRQPGGRANRMQRLRHPTSRTRWRTDHRRSSTSDAIPGRLTRATPRIT
ncbi:MAG: hypothetical protein U0804_20410 [Gemmataceae bacterium]